jgi:hypothetical protein
VAYEAAIWLTGNTTNALTTMATTDVTRAGVQLSPNRLYIAELRIGGAVTGTVPTMDVVIGIGSTAAILATGQSVGAFPQQTQSNVTVRPETATGAARAAVQRIAFRVPEEKTFVRAQITMSGGTTAPVFPNMSILVIPVKENSAS